MNRDITSETGRIVAASVAGGALFVFFVYACLVFIKIKK